MGVSTAELADAEGPNASIDYGGAKQLSSLQREGGQFAHGGQTQQPQQPQQGPTPSQGPGPSAGSPSPSPPVQPGPPSPTQQGWDPKQYFEKPRVGQMNAQSWHDEVSLLASHRSAGPALRAMKRQLDEAQQK